MALAAALLAVHCATQAVMWPLESGHAVPPAATSVDKSPYAARPLAGKVVVIDPGHQLGNRNFPAEINRQVPAGGFTKPCNTTGTATDGGYPEATFVWQV